MTTYYMALPWDAPLLTANQRQHHMARARIVKRLRTEAAWRARADLPRGLQHVEVRMHYRPRDRRRRDADNLVPTLKALCDGLVDAGIVPDDTPDLMTKHMPEIHPPDRELGPAVWLEIIAKDTAE